MKLKGNLNNRVCFWAIVLVLLLIFVSCEKEADKPLGNNKVVLTSTTASSPGYFTANVSGSLTQTGGNTLTDHGFCYATTPNPDISATVKNLGNRTEQGDFSAELTNLDDDQKYFVRAFATFSGGTLYAEQKEIKTLKTGKPQIITTPLSDITLISAVCGGIIESDSGYAITDSGICWDTVNTFNETQCLDKAINTNGSSTFSLNMTSLYDGTTYFVKAYATNQKGTGYGETRPFSSATITIPTVTTNTVTNPNSNSAVCGGNVTNDGKATVTARGVCWNTSGDPTLQNSMGFTTDGQGTGSFSSIVTGLTTLNEYFVKAYATNSEGTAYGNQQNFTTTVPWTCGEALSVTHTTGSIAPINKTVNYGTALTNLTGSNRCWITQNLGADCQATIATDATEASAGWYWQFNKKQGFKHDGFIYTPITTWISSISENSDWLPTNDPCTLLLGGGWRLPTNTEWQTANASSGWDSYNETFSSVLKLHAAGYLNNHDGSLHYRGSYGFYRSSSQGSSIYGTILMFNSDFSIMNNDSKANGSSLRCLRD